MFFVVNKPKIFSYLVVLSTVVVLFFTAEVLSESKNIEVLTTSAELTEKNSIIIDRIDTEKKEVVITINCSKNNKNIEKILEILDENNVKASFCINSDWVKKYPELTQKISKSGNTIIGLFDNYKETNNSNYEITSKWMLSELNIINTLLNKNIKLIRCYFDLNNENIKKVVTENNLKIIEYSIDSLDYEGLEINVIWDNINNKIKNGDIILVDSNSEHILEEIDYIIKNLKQKGYDIVNLEEKL